MHRSATLLLIPLLAACGSEQKLGTFNAEPLVTITSPADGSAVVAGADVVLTGTVSDPDGPVHALSVTWTRDGVPVCLDAEVDEIGNTNCITSFEEGGGSATLQVMDPAGGAATDTITLAVIEDVPPSVVIVSPSESGLYYSDQMITLEGNLSDPEDPPEALDGDLGVFPRWDPRP